MYIWSELIMSEATIETFVYRRSFHKYTYVIKNKQHSVKFLLENFYLHRLHFPTHLSSYMQQLFIYISIW